jgi:hypothetical protein
MSATTRVLLYELAGLAIVVPSPTGVLYRNQAGGHACLPCEAEGYLVPLAGETYESVDRLRSYFIGPKWGGWCANGIDAETADEIDRIMADYAHRDQITVDRTRLDESCESWIHVKVSGQLLSLIENDLPANGILTWPNSD